MRQGAKDDQKASTSVMSPQVWGCHDGDEPGQLRAFFRQGYIAIGWGSLGDFSIHSTRKDFQAAVTREYPTMDARKRGRIWSQIHAFVKVMRIGDLVVTPPRSTPNDVWIGRVAGDYEYQPDVGHGFPMVRRVDWLRQDVRWSDLTDRQHKTWSRPPTLFRITDPEVERWALRLSGSRR